MMKHAIYTFMWLSSFRAKTSDSAKYVHVLFLEVGDLTRAGIWQQSLGDHILCCFQVSRDGLAHTDTVHMVD